MNRSDMGEEKYKAYLESGKRYLHNKCNMAALLHNPRSNVPMLFYLHDEVQKSNTLLREIADYLKSAKGGHQ